MSITSDVIDAALDDATPASRLRAVLARWDRHEPKRADYTDWLDYRTLAEQEREVAAELRAGDPRLLLAAGVVTRMGTHPAPPPARVVYPQTHTVTADYATSTGRRYAVRARATAGGWRVFEVVATDGRGEAGYVPAGPRLDAALDDAAAELVESAARLRDRRAARWDAAAATTPHCSQLDDAAIADRVREYAAGGEMARCRAVIGALCLIRRRLLARTVVPRAT